MSVDFILPLLVFMADLLAISLHGLAAAGQFPYEHRSPALRTRFGLALLFGSIAVAWACFACDSLVRGDHWGRRDDVDSAAAASAFPRPVRRRHSGSADIFRRRCDADVHFTL